MSALPSFVELMASLGLQDGLQKPEWQSISPDASPRLSSERAVSSPIKAKSTPSLRDIASKQNTTRYSPYSPTMPTRRRGSVSSSSSSGSSGNVSPTEEAFNSPPRSSRSRRNPLGLQLYGGSTSELQANLPISTYVRRKSPSTTPITPSFPREDYTSAECAPASPMTLTIPVLPSALLPHSASSDSFPITPRDSDAPSPGLLSPPSKDRSKPFVWDYSEFDNRRQSHSTSPHFTGVRISNASRCSSLNEQSFRRAVPTVL